MNKIMIIDIPLNSKEHPFFYGFEKKYKVANNMAQTKEWISYRIGIFMKYTFKCLIHQTNQNFTCIVRYEKSSEEIITKELSKYQKLPNNIIFTTDGDEFIKNSIKKYDYLYHIRLDSDNMYSTDFIQILWNMEYSEGLQCILCQNGYIYDNIHNRIATIYHKSPSFYALIYKTEDYLNDKKYIIEDDHIGAYKLNHKTIDSNCFIIIVHGRNLSNRFDSIVNAFNCTLLDENEKNNIFKEWSIE